MIQPFLIFNSWAILILRVALGIILVAHGWPKLKNLKATAASFTAMGFKPGRFWGTLVAVLEFFGGLFLIGGFLTQAVSVLVVIQFLVIILKVKASKGLVEGYEFDLLIAAAALLLATTGGGAHTLDRALRIFIY